MILQTFLWYLLLTLLGWISFPIAFVIFPNLRDRGYGLSRVLGLLFWGYIFWLATSLDVSRNNPAGITFAAILLLFISLKIVQAHGLAPFRSWYQENHRQVWVIEGLFAFAFGLMVMIRAANAEALGTEKPMELAFINAILHSESFPPHDPWLSGYAISYYYFGYILIAMLAKINTTPGSIAFNLGISMIFALSAISAYSILSDLLAAKFKKLSLWKPLLAPLLALCVGNIEGFLEVLHAAGFFWKLHNGQWSSPFWKWMDLVELTNPPQVPFSGMPSRWYWWWRASRVIQDYDLASGLREVIDEFPAFSYILADLHPHVLAMPFAFLAISVALNLFLNPVTKRTSHSFSYPFAKIKLFTIRYPLSLPVKDSILIALILGSLAFLNTWDFPIYVALCALVYSIWLWQASVQEEHKLVFTVIQLRELFKNFILFTIWIGFWGLLFYLPFYLGFSSQAGGILPNLIYPSRGAQLWVMFAPLWIPLFAYLLYTLVVTKSPLKLGFFVSIALFTVLWAISIVFGILISVIPYLNDLFLGSIAAADMKSWLYIGIQRRLLYSGGWITLILILAAVIGLLIHYFRSALKPALFLRSNEIDESSGYILLLTLLAGLLVLIPDFFFLRDQFGWRINTVFKFYYQAWLLWSIAAAYCIANFPTITSKIWRSVFISLSLIGISLGLVYTILATLTKTNSFNPPEGWTLDSSAYYLHQSYDEMQAINFISEQPHGAVAEAISPTGGSYTQYARVATFSGQPAVLGWTGHESQWRGGTSEMGSRQPDLTRLYCTSDWLEALQVIQKYSIKYIFIGELERNTYTRGSEACPNGINEQKFHDNLIPIFQQGTAIIYYVP